MGLKKEGDNWYGENHDDLRQVVVKYSKENAYEATRFKNLICDCGSTTFFLLVDDNEGAAIRVCSECEEDHSIGDSEAYLEEASLEQCICLCENEAFEITAALALYDKSNDVRWIYLGCRCPNCGLSGVYGDWKNEHNDVDMLLKTL